MTPSNITCCLASVFASPPLTPRKKSFVRSFRVSFAQMALTLLVYKYTKNKKTGKGRSRLLGEISAHCDVNEHSKQARRARQITRQPISTTTPPLRPVLCCERASRVSAATPFITSYIRKLKFRPSLATRGEENGKPRSGVKPVNHYNVDDTQKHDYNQSSPPPEPPFTCWIELLSGSYLPLSPSTPFVLQCLSFFAAGAAEKRGNTSY